MAQDAQLITLSYSHYYIDDLGASERDKNWQLISTYAEGNKRKDVVEYVDGTSKVHQRVTVSNTDYTAIVQETKYDYLGRPMVEYLPGAVPSTGLEYYHHPSVGTGSFNQGNYKGSYFDEGC